MEMIQVKNNLITIAGSRRNEHHFKFCSRIQFTKCHKKHRIGIMKRTMNRGQKQATGGCWKMLLDMATITENNNKNIYIYICKSTPAFTQDTF